MTELETIIALCLMSIFRSALPFLLSLCPDGGNISGKFLSSLWQVLNHSTFLNLLPRLFFLANLLYTRPIKQLYVVERFGSNFVRQADFSKQSPGWQIHQPNYTLNRNMLPGGQSHTLFKELCLSLLWSEFTTTQSASLVSCQWKNI